MVWRVGLGTAATLHYVLVVQGLLASIVGAQDWGTPDVPGEMFHIPPGPTADVVQDHWSEVALMHRPKRGSPLASVECPHAPGSNALSFNDPKAWVNGVLPRQVLNGEASPGATIRQNTRVMVHKDSVDADKIYEHIVIPKSSSLIFADESIEMQTRGFHVQAGVVKNRTATAICHEHQCVTMHKNGSLQVKPKPASLAGYDATFKFEQVKVPANDGTNKVKVALLNVQAQRIVVLRGERPHDAGSKLVEVTDEMSIDPADAFTVLKHNGQTAFHMDSPLDRGRFLRISDDMVSASDHQDPAWPTVPGDGPKFFVHMLPSTLPPGNPKVGLCSSSGNICITIASDGSVTAASISGAFMPDSLSNDMLFEKVTFPNHTTGFLHVQTRRYLIFSNNIVESSEAVVSSYLPGSEAQFRFHYLPEQGWTLRNDQEQRFLRVDATGFVSTSSSSPAWESTTADVLWVPEFAEVSSPNPVMALCSSMLEEEHCIKVDEAGELAPLARPKDVVTNNGVGLDDYDPSLQWEMVRLASNSVAWYHPLTRRLLAFYRGRVITRLHLLNEPIPEEASFELWHDGDGRSGIYHPPTDKLIGFAGKEMMPLVMWVTQPVLDHKGFHSFWNYERWTFVDIASRGRLLLGSEQCPLQTNTKITLRGDRPDATVLEQPGYIKGIYVTGGELQAHGLRYEPTWTRLAQTASAGDTTILVQDAVNWQPGQTIVITTTERADSRAWHANEERIIDTVKSVPALGPRITMIELTQPLIYEHWGGRDYQAEVGLLSRSVKIEGHPDDSRPTDTATTCSGEADSKQSPYPCQDAWLDGYGGHILVTHSEGPGAVGYGMAKLSGVELVRMGQTNRMGRYPYNLHLLGSFAKHSFLRGSSIHGSYFRAAVLHASDNSEVSQLVAYNITGHGLYLESGTEELNEIHDNLVAHVHMLGQVNHRYEADASWISRQAGLLNPSDNTASPFYISNLNNSLLGNAASGGWSGFLFPAHHAPFASGNQYKDMSPNAKRTLAFDGNSAHSAGYWHINAAGFYFGGSFDQTFSSYFHGPGPLVHQPCREVQAAETTCPLQMYVANQFNNSKVFLSSRGLHSWGGMYQIDKLETHDCNLALSAMGYATVKNWLSVAWGPHQARYLQGCSAASPESCAMRDWHDRNGGRRAFQWQGMHQLRMVFDSEFRGYDDALVGNTPRCLFAPPQGRCPPTAVWEIATHSDYELPGIMHTAKNITYTNCNLDQLFTYTAYGIDIYERLSWEGQPFRFYGDDSNKCHGSFERNGSISGLLHTFLDVDGTFLPENGGVRTLIGSAWANDWFWFNEDCHKSVTESGMPDLIACPLVEKLPNSDTERFTLGSFRMTVDKQVSSFIRPRPEIGEAVSLCTDEHESACPRVGYVTYGNSDKTFSGLGLASHNLVAGIVDSLDGIWYVRWNIGAPKSVQFEELQLAAGAKVVLALPYPLSVTGFTIRGEIANSNGLCGEQLESDAKFLCSHEFQSVDSVAEVRNAPLSDKFYWDEADGVLYVLLVQMPGDYLAATQSASATPEWNPTTASQRVQGIELDGVHMVFHSGMGPGYVVTITAECDACEDVVESPNRTAAEEALPFKGTLSYPGHTPYWRLDGSKYCVRTADPDCSLIAMPAPAPTSSAYRSVAIYSPSQQAFLTVDALPGGSRIIAQPADASSAPNVKSIFEMVSDGCELFGFYNADAQGFITMTTSSTELSLSNTASLAELSASWADQLFEIVKGADEQVVIHSRAHRRHWTLAGAVLEKTADDRQAQNIGLDWQSEYFKLVEVSSSSIWQTEVIIHQGLLAIHMVDPLQAPVLRKGPQGALFDIVTNGLAGDFEGVGLYHRGSKRFVRMADWQTVEFSDVIADGKLQPSQVREYFRKVIVDDDKVAFYNIVHERFLSVKMNSAGVMTLVPSKRKVGQSASPDNSEIFRISASSGAVDWATPPITSEVDPTVYPPSNEVVRDHWSELVTLPRPEQGVAFATVGCPHAPGTGKTVKFSDAAAWKDGALPRRINNSEASLGATIRQNTRVLVEKSSVEASAIYEHIVIPKGSSMIFADEEIQMQTRGIHIQAGVVKHRTVVSICQRALQVGVPVSRSNQVDDQDRCFAMMADGTLLLKEKPSSVAGYDATFKFEQVPVGADKVGLLNVQAQRLLILVGGDSNDAGSKHVEVSDEMSIDAYDAFTVIEENGKTVFHMGSPDTANPGRFLRIHNGVVDTSDKHEATWAAVPGDGSKFDVEALPATLSPGNPRVGLCSSEGSSCIVIGDDGAVTTNTRGYSEHLPASMVFEKVTFPNHANGFLHVASRRYLTFSGGAVTSSMPASSSYLPGPEAQFRFHLRLSEGWTLRNDQEMRFLHVDASEGISASKPRADWALTSSHSFLKVEELLEASSPNPVQAICASAMERCINVDNQGNLEAAARPRMAGDTMLEDYDPDTQWEKLSLPNNKFALYHSSTRRLLALTDGGAQIATMLHLLNTIIPDEATFNILEDPQGRQALYQPTVNKHIGFSGDTLVVRDTINWPSEGLEFVDVASRGKLLLGSEQCPLQSNHIKITLRGDRPSVPISAEEFQPGYVKGIFATGGELQAHGLRYEPTWTRLARTANANDNVIFVQDAVNWQPGQTIVVTTTERADSRAWHRNEERIIKALRLVPNLGPRIVAIELTEPLAHKHWGGKDYQAEVGLLSRSIMIEGHADDSMPTKTALSCTGVAQSAQSPYPCQDSWVDGYGGHILVTYAAGGVGYGIAKVSGVELVRMGQTNRMGRYSYHLHHLGTFAKHSFLRSASVHKSFFRAAVIHASDYSEVSQLVAYDIIGHGLYLESGSEEFNKIEHNLIAFVHILGPLNHQFLGGIGWVFKDLFAFNPRLIPSDSTASPYYISNLHNYLRGNAASGGWAGFAFPVHREPIHAGVQRKNINPATRTTLVFDGNSAHSSGYWQSIAGGFYFGGTFTNDFNGYFNDRNTAWGQRHQPCRQVQVALGVCPLDLLVPNYFTNTKAFLSSRGWQSWGGMYKFDKLETLECPFGLSVFGHAAVKNWLSVVWGRHQAQWAQGCGDPDRAMTQCGRRDWWDRDGGRIAFQWYDLNQHHMIFDAEFRGYHDKFEPGKCRFSPGFRSPTNKCTKNFVWEVLSHNDAALPGIMQTVKNITYKDCNLDRLFRYTGYAFHLGQKTWDGKDYRFYGDDQNRCHGSFERGGTISGNLPTWLDVDGTFLPENGGVRTLIGSSWANEWFQFNDKCHKPVTTSGMPDFIACPMDEKLPGTDQQRYTLGAFRMSHDGALGQYMAGGLLCQNSHTAACPLVGYVTHGNRPRADRGLALASHNVAAGIVDSLEGMWYVRWRVGAPKFLILHQIQMTLGARLILALPYPKSTSRFLVRALILGPAGWCPEHPVTELANGKRRLCRYDFTSVGSLEELRNDPVSNKYFWDASLGVLYVGVVQMPGAYLASTETGPDLAWNPALAAKRVKTIEQDGIEMTFHSFGQYDLRITADCFGCESAMESPNQTEAVEALTSKGTLTYPGHLPYWKLDHDKNCVLTADPECKETEAELPPSSAYRKVAIYSDLQKAFLTVDPTTRKIVAQPANSINDFDHSWTRAIFEIVSDGCQFFGFYSEAEKGYIAMLELSDEMEVLHHPDKSVLNESLTRLLHEFSKGPGNEVMIFNRDQFRHWRFDATKTLKKHIKRPIWKIHGAYSVERPQYFTLLELSYPSDEKLGVTVRHTSSSVRLADLLLGSANDDADFDIISNGMAGEFEGVGLFHRTSQRFVRMVDWLTIGFSEERTKHQINHTHVLDTFRKVQVGDRVAFYNVAHERFLSVRTSSAGVMQAMPSDARRPPLVPEEADLFII